MEAEECAAELWSRLLEQPGELERLADDATADPCALLWSTAAHEPKNGGRRPPGWLFTAGGGYGSSQVPLKDWLEPADPGTDPYVQLDDGTTLTPVHIVVDRILDVLLCRTPEPLHESVTEAVLWMAERRIQWRHAPAYVRDAIDACPDLNEDQVRTLVAVIWGSNKRQDMSLFNLFRWDAAAVVAGHGAVYRSVCTYRERINGWKKRQSGTSSTAA